jgi:hypothetical protein
VSGDATRRPEGRRTDGYRRPGGSGDGRGGSGGSGSGRGGRGSSGNGRTGGLPSWALPAAGGIVVLILLLVVLKACSGGGGSSDSGACLSDLATHLPKSAIAVAGTDLVQARHQGLDDTDSLDVLAATKDATGAIPDAVTFNYRMRGGAIKERFEAETGVTTADIHCSLGTGTVAVLSGTFDPASVKGADAGSKGRLAATDDLLALSTGSQQAAPLLKTAADDGVAGDEAMLDTIESLRDNDAFSVIVQRGDGKNGRALAAGVGVGGKGDDRFVALAWRFDSDADAKEGRPEITDRVNSMLKGSVTIRNTELTVDGTLVTAVVQATNAPDLQGLFDDSTFRLVNKPS